MFRASHQPSAILWHSLVRLILPLCIWQLLAHLRSRADQPCGTIDEISVATHNGIVENLIEFQPQIQYSVKLAIGV
ncbi:hypothetical protein F5Y09DRAFT_91837 [Xylaria sp. FL1042]|nr:hypothetical protein F5Y09DRAFT_91837 [Xylaria sp. FL1042]